MIHIIIMVPAVPTQYRYLKQHHLPYLYNVPVSRGYTIITGRLARKNNDVSRNNTTRRQSQEYCVYDVRFAIFIVRLHTPQDTTIIIDGCAY